MTLLEFVGTVLQYLVVGSVLFIIVTAVARPFHRMLHWLDEDK